MDMQDPRPEELQAAPENPTPEAEAPAAEAGMTSTAVSEDAEPDAEPEIEVELLMSDAEEEAEEQATPVRQELTLESLLALAHELQEKEAGDLSMDEIRRLRQQTAMLHKPAAVAEDAEGAQGAPTDPVVVEINSIIEALRTRKAEWTAAQEAARAENLRIKNEIIEQIIALAEDTDNVNRTFPRYLELQEQFNTTGDVAPTEETSLWKRFQEARERYSDNLKINKELRDYDFKKNLTEKETLLEEATALSTEEDVIGAYRRLQELHNRWRQIGPVAKELRDEIWNKFRDASAEVNKRYQAFFEARKAREAENEAGKTALCEKIEAIDLTAPSSYAKWDELTKEVMELQEQWRGFGFAPKKVNRALFARFRAACDAFFAAKAEYYRSARESLNANLERKQALTARAEELANSTDWKAAGDELMEMQKEWKTIGAIPKKYSDALWKRFTTACDAFFAAKKKAGSGQRATESANLRTKREIIGLISALTAEGVDKDTAIEELRKLQARWQETGHVPFREKDKVQMAYRDAVDAVRDQFEMARKRDRRQRFEESVAQIQGDDNKIFRERERLMRIAENRRNDLRTYENNLGFLSAKSKSGDSLMRDLSRRIEALKADIADLEEKIKILDSKLS